MELNRTPNELDRNARNKENENWDKIEGNLEKIGNSVNDFIGTVTSEVVNELVDKAKLDWEEPVNNFNSLPTNAEVGETRMTKDNGNVYRYNGTDWEYIQQIDAGPVNELDSRLTSQLNDTINVVSDYTLYPQSPKPEKNGIKERTAKIVFKETNNDLRVIQKTNKGYVGYTFSKNNGASIPDRDYGENHELMRITKSRPIEDAYVYYDIGSPITGDLQVQHPSNAFNTAEILLFYLPSHNPDNTFSSKGVGGFATYKLDGNAEITYKLFATKENKANILFYCSAGSSDDVEIIVNDKVVKSFSPKSFVVDGGQAAAIIDFDVPVRNSGTTEYTVKIKNKSNAVCYPCAINFLYLKDYRNQHINQFKCFGSLKEGWIESNGASDYAIFDADEKKWFGSYHGGEISLYDRLKWHNIYEFERNDYDISQASFSSIDVGEWRVLSDFTMYQHTELANGQAEMVSIFDFNTDGTLEMSFGYSGSVKANPFYTALTSTHSAFRYVAMPVNHNLGSNPTNDFYPIPLSEGYIKQMDPTNGLELDIRFTKFNNKHDVRGAVIADNSTYRKLYYGPIYGKATTINSLSFSKGLDFIVR